MYSQQDRWVSKVTYLDRVFTACHFSVGIFVVGGCEVAGVCAGYVYWSGLVYSGVFAVAGGSLLVLFCTTYFSPIFRAVGIHKATCLSKISSCVS